MSFTELWMPEGTFRSKQTTVTRFQVKFSNEIQLLITETQIGWILNEIKPICFLRAQISTISWQHSSRVLSDGKNFLLKQTR